MVQSQVEKKTSENKHDDNLLFLAERLARFLPSERFMPYLKIKSLNNLLSCKDGMNRNGIVTIKNHLSIYPDKWHAIRKAKNDIIAKESVNRLDEQSSNVMYLNRNIIAKIFYFSDYHPNRGDTQFCRIT